MFRGRKKDRNDPSSPFEGLRNMALTLAASDVGAADSPETKPFGVVVDIPKNGAYACVVALADGTTSLYTSAGGGVIGAGTHESVAHSTRRMLEVLGDRVQMFPASDGTDLPPGEYVQVTLLTRGGRRRASIDLPVFWGEAPTSIPDIIGAIQDVITELRRIQPDEPSS